MRKLIIVIVILSLGVVSADASDILFSGGDEGGHWAVPQRSDEYVHDDGSNERCLGTSAGSAIAWIHAFESHNVAKTITHVSTAFGMTGGSGCAPAGTPITVYIWDDPNNDGDPSDAVLLAQGEGLLQNPDTAILNHYALEAPVTVGSRFFVGVSVVLDGPYFPGPMDEDQASSGRAWAVGEISGNLDAENLMNNSTPPYDIDDLVPSVFLLRADALALDAACQSFDSADGTDVVGWSEYSGDWSIQNRMLQSEDVASQQWITLDSIIQADGCIEGRAIYGDGVSARYIGVSPRRISPSTYLLVKVQDNSNCGYWDSCFFYDGTAGVASVQNQNWGTDANIQVEYVGTSVTLRIDPDRDGVWDHEYSATVTTTGAGLTGVSAFGHAFMDDFCAGSSASAWSGAVADFDDVPQTYWRHGGNQNLGSHYSGLTFGPQATVLEDTVHGYNSSYYPYHSFDAVLYSSLDDQIRVDFDAPSDHVGVWYSSGAGSVVLRGYDNGGNLLGAVVGSEKISANGCLLLNTAGIDYVTLDGTHGQFCLDDFQWVPGASSSTVATDMTCLPSSGTVPFATTMAMTLTNQYTEQIRRLAGRIDVLLASGSNFSNWRKGSTNLTPGENYVVSWSQTFPAVASVIGDNIFSLYVEDITPAPYNQPPYPPAGDTDTAGCVVTGVSP